MTSEGDQMPADPAARKAEQDILQEIESKWTSVEGPARASFRWRRTQGEDGALPYTSWTFTGPQPRYGSPADGPGDVADLGVATRWVSDALDGWAAAVCGASPKTHRLVWRKRPEVGSRNIDGVVRWNLYMRLAFMPLDAWLLVDEGDSELSRPVFEIVDAERPE